MTEQSSCPNDASEGNTVTNPMSEATTVAPWIRLVAACAAIAVLGFLGVLAYAYFTSESSGRVAGIQVNTAGSLEILGNREAPNFRLTTLQSDDEIELYDFRGKVVIVNFWASWCPPCRDEAAKLEEFHQTSNPEEVVLIGVSVWDQESDAETFLNRYGKTYLNGIDERNIAIDYGGFGIPETFFIGPDGTLLGRYTGPLESAEQIQRFVQELTSVE